MGLRVLPPAQSCLVFPRPVPHKLASLDLPFTDPFQKLESSSHHELMFWQRKKYQFNNLWLVQAFPHIHGEKWELPGGNLKFKEVECSDLFSVLLHR